MSEALSYETVSVAEAEVQTEAFDSSAMEVTDDWDSELTSLVRENAHVLVKPSWMDVELPLGAAMYHIKISRDNVSWLVAEVRQSLADRPRELEEQEEEIDTEVEAKPQDEDLQQTEQILTEEEISNVEVEKKDGLEEKAALAEKADVPEKTKNETTEIIHAEEQNIVQETETTQQSATAEHNAGAEHAERQINQTIAANEQQAKKEAVASKPQEASVKEAKESPAAEKTDAVEVEAKVTTSDVESKPEQSVQSDDGSKTTESSPSSFEADTAEVEPSSTAESSSAAADKSVGSGQEVISAEVGQEPASNDPITIEAIDEIELDTPTEIEAEPQTAVFEASDANAVADPIVETNLPNDESSLVELQDDEVPVAPEAIEELDGLNYAERLPQEPAAVNELDIDTEIGDEVLVATEDELELPTPDYQIGLDSSAVLIEEEPVLERAEEEGSVLEIDEQGEPYRSAPEVAENVLEPEIESLIIEKSIEPLPAEQTEIEIDDTATEQFQFSLPIEEIEDSLAQVAERIETSEPQTIEIVNETLDKIIELSAKIEDQEDDDMIAEAEVQEELEELFIELFDRAEVDYTPELIESLARFTVQYRLSDEVKKIAEEESDELPQDTGTHEVIMQLLVGMDLTKKALEHAYILGKSALRLSFNLVTSPSV